MKKFLLASTALCLLLIVAACGGGSKPDLVISSFTDELQDVIDVFEEKYDVTVELQIIPTDDYQTTLQPSLESGSGAPDIFTGELAWLKLWLEQDYWVDLSQEPYNVEEWASDYVDYSFDLGRDSDGNVRAVTWQVTPGGIFYRRSIAQEVFGTDDPAVIGEKFSTIEGLLAAGEELKAHNYRLFPDEGSIRHYIDGQDPQPWVNENNELVMTQARIDYFDYAKQLREADYTAFAPEWSPAWYASFNGPINYNAGWDAVDENASNQTEVFSVSLPTWGLHSVLKNNAPDTAGDWAVTNGPTPYFWGGTWLGIYEGSENKELAFEFIKMMVNDEEFLTEWALETGDVLSFLPVTEKIRGDFSDSFLGGQNNYEFFLEQADLIDASTVTRYDQQIGGLHGTAVGDYVEGRATKEEALQQFYDAVKNAYPNITVPEVE